jgi:hypothetical protein
MITRTKVEKKTRLDDLTKRNWTANLKETKPIHIF